MADASKIQYVFFSLGATTQHPGHAYLRTTFEVSLARYLTYEAIC
jgi:hypothetical protein